MKALAGEAKSDFSPFPNAGLNPFVFRERQAGESYFSWLSNPYTTGADDQRRYNRILAEQANPATIQNSFDRQAALSLQDGLMLVPVGGYAKWLATLAVESKVVQGAALGGTFYTAGQYSKDEPFRFGELVLNVTTGAVAGPLAGTNAYRNAILGGSVNATNTAVANGTYGEDKSVLVSFGIGALFGGFGTVGGKVVTSTLSSALPAYVGGVAPNPSLPALLYKFGVPNPYPGYIGFWVSQGISNVPSFYDFGSSSKK